jgi:formate hydrogenlyase subunit 4
VTAAAVLAQAVLLGGLAPVLPGVVTRTKSWWAGRRGAPVLQPAYDLVKLMRKRAVYSATTTALFRVAPWTVLGATVVASLVVPLAGPALVSFPGDVVFFAYAWGLARAAMMLGALDTGSPFEGMAASREATFSTLLEPALFLLAGGVGLVGDVDTLGAMVQVRGHDATGWLVWALSVVTLTVLVQVEAARLPVDDPTTHLELTMVHEGMILDHSGPDLAALQYAAGLKLATGLALLAALFVPVGLPPWAAGLATAAGCLALAVGLGTVESLTARLRMRAVPAYVLVALFAAGAAVLASAWHGNGGAL